MKKKKSTPGEEGQSEEDGIIEKCELRDPLNPHKEDERRNKKGSKFSLEPYAIVRRNVCIDSYVD